MKILILNTILLLAVISCNQETNIESEKSESGFYISNKKVVLNNYPIQDSFVYEKFIKVFGKPDEVVVSDSLIFLEFGANDYRIKYNNNLLSAGHGYIDQFEINSKQFNLNNITIGCDLELIENVFNLSIIVLDTVKISTEDSYLVFILDSYKKVKKINYYSPNT